MTAIELARRSISQRRMDDRQSRWLSGKVTVTPGVVAAQTRQAIPLAIKYATPGDTIDWTPPAGLEAGLQGAGSAITGRWQVTLYVTNVTGAGIAGAARVWVYGIRRSARPTAGGVGG